MRRLLSAVLLVVGSAVAVLPASAQSIIDRPPMDLGADQVGTISRVGQDLLHPPARPSMWWEIGMSWPIGTLDDQNLNPGLLLRANQRFWNDDALGLVASLGVLFANDSYFNDAQEEIAFNAPVDPFSSYSGVDIQTRYFWTVPAMVDLEFAPKLSESMVLNFSAGPGVAWSHDAVVTSAVNNGVGGDQDSSLVIGPGGEQGISPYAIRTRTTFNLGWDAKAGIGFKVSQGDRPLWVRAQVSGVTYYHHTAPRTLLGFTASFGR